jgi:hypothetical protein
LGSDQAPAQFHINGDDAPTTHPVDLGRTAAQGQVGNGGQWGRAGLAGDPQVGDGVQVLTHGLVQVHPDGKLTLWQV